MYNGIINELKKEDAGSFLLHLKYSWVNYWSRDLTIIDHV